MYEVVVDPELCDGCESCVDICPSEVFKMQDGLSVPVNVEDCTGCESCVEECHNDAITVTEM